MTVPSPDARLAERLRGLPPDACRALLAAFDRARLRGGGSVEVTFEVGGCGEVEAVEVRTRFERALDERGYSVGGRRA